jgi:hypothetical protein
MGMFMSRFIRHRMINYDVFMRRKRQPDTDLKSNAVAMLLAGCNHFNTAACNTMIVGLKPLYFTKYLRTRRVRGFRSFEGNLRCDLHFATLQDLIPYANPRSAEWLHPCCDRSTLNTRNQA